VKILLVDDSTLSRKVQAKVLREVGLEDIVEAKNGLDALKKLEELDFRVELMLTDWNMPGMDGMNLIAEVRKHPKGASLPIIVISSEGEEERIAEAFSVGASSYVTKPFKKEILARKIKSVRCIAEVQQRTPPEGDAPLIEGDLKQLGFAELVGFLNFTKKTGEMILDLETGQAGVSFKDGEVQDAWIGRFATEDAFYAIATLGVGRFSFHEGRPPRQQRIKMGTMGLLMQAMKLLDEGESESGG